MTQDGFMSQLSMFFRDLPHGTSADLNDCIVAYWNGKAVVFAFLCEPGNDAVDEEFDLDDYVWEEWQPDFERWLKGPVFSVRPEILQWLKEAPPHDGGA
ncbi:hypothetical protein LMG28614_06725 [Paraburkholderia ultramafica]|uniref:Uncharacterized protein n=2 Tax=Paraburkholderia ultramafica TaxID=1544867 RepID=A0A6S7CF38_9BURK|nr:hypothetical protein LMG28614_06725 [Paraburkholderia ultramafica]